MECYFLFRGISRKKSQHFYYKVWAAGFQPVFLFPLFYYPRSAGKKGNWNNETISCGHYRMHRHGGPAVRHHFGEPPLVPRYGGGRQRQKRRQDLRGGRSRPLGHEDPSPRRHGEAPCAGRGKRYWWDRLSGGLRLLRREHEEGRDPRPGGGLRQEGVPGGLQQQRPPLHPGRSHDHPGDQRRPRGGHPVPAQAPGHQAGLCVRQVQLLSPELRPRHPSPVGPGSHQGAGLHLPGHLRGRQDLRDHAPDS